MEGHVSIQDSIRGVGIAILKSKIFPMFLFTILVVYVGSFLEISIVEWLLIVFCVSILMSLEVINTSIELLCNIVEPNENRKIKEIKDISAGAVLISAISSVLIGMVIFIPKLVGLFC